MVSICAPASSLSSSIDFSLGRRATKGDHDSRKSPVIRVSMYVLSHNGRSIVLRKIQQIEV